MTNRENSQQKDLVKEVAERLGVAQNHSQAAIIQYSDSATVQARFGQYPTMAEFAKAVDALLPENGSVGRRFDKAFRLAATEIIPEGREGVLKLVLLIIHGALCSDLKVMREVSEPVRKAGFYVIAVNVGHTYAGSKRQLKQITKTDDNVMDYPKPLSEILKNKLGVETEVIQILRPIPIVTHKTSPVIKTNKKKPEKKKPKKKVPKVIGECHSKVNVFLKPIDRLRNKDGPF